MVPAFLTLAAPLCKLYRIPLCLWYVHWHANRALRLATRLADVVFSVNGRGLALETPKVLAIGHAIEHHPVLGTTEAGAAGEPLPLLALGRTTRWKGYTTSAAGFASSQRLRGLESRLEIRGPSLTFDEQAHRAELEESVAASPALRQRVAWSHPVPRGGGAGCAG